MKFNIYRNLYLKLLHLIIWFEEKYPLHCFIIALRSEKVYYVNVYKFIIIFLFDKYRIGIIKGTILEL